MEKSDAIHRAVRQAPAPELPAGFTARLMKRMRREEIRRERRETWLLTAGGICCFGALIAACVTVLWPDLKLRMPDIALPHLKLPCPALPEADHSPVAKYICIALVFLMLLLVDLLIRRRIASSRD